MKKHLKTILIILGAVVAVGAAVYGLFLWMAAVISKIVSKAGLDDDDLFFEPEFEPVVIDSTDE